MATLLRIDSSPLGSDASFSRQLTTEFVQQWQRVHVDGKLVTRDLATTQLQPVSAEWIATGQYEVEVAAERVPARVSLRPFYDPASERVKR